MTDILIAIVILAMIYIAYQTQAQLIVFI